MDYLMKEFLVQQKIGNVLVEDTKEFVIEELYVKDVELRLQEEK